MKIADLIATLQNIYNENGDIDVHFSKFDQDDYFVGTQLAEDVYLDGFQQLNRLADGTYKDEEIKYVVIS